MQIGPGPHSLCLLQPSNQMSSKTVFVLGASGGLGRTIVETFVKRNWHTIAADFTASPVATKSFTLGKEQSWAERSRQLHSSLQDHLGDQKLDSIVNVAGGV